MTATFAKIMFAFISHILKSSHDESGIIFCLVRYMAQVTVLILVWINFFSHRVQSRNAPITLTGPFLQQSLHWPLIFSRPTAPRKLSLQQLQSFFAADGAHWLHRSSCKNKFDHRRLCFDVSQIPEQSRRGDSIFFYGAAIEWSAPCDSGHSDHALSSATSLLLQATRSAAPCVRPHTYRWTHCLAESFDSWINYFANALWHKTVCV